MPEPIRAEQIIGDFTHVEPWREVGVGDNPSFENSWVNFDSTRKARFYKDPFGVVHLGGLIKTGTLGTTAFTLPSGYFPDYVDATNQDILLPVMSNAALGYLKISYLGQVIPNTGSNVWFSLDGASFRVE